MGALKPAIDLLGGAGVVPGRSKWARLSSAREGSVRLSVMTSVRAAETPRLTESIKCRMSSRPRFGFAAGRDHRLVDAQVASTSRCSSVANKVSSRCFFLSVTRSVPVCSVRRLVLSRGWLLLPR